MDRITRHLAASLRAARLAKKLTQEELAERLGIATESVSHIERAVSAPSLKTIAAAADALDVTMVDLLAGYDKDPPMARKRAQHASQLRRYANDLDDRRLALLLALAKAVEEAE